MVFYAWIDIKFLVLSIFNFQLWKLIFNINRFQGQTSFSTAPPPTCPPDKPHVYCFVDSCQVTTCPAHPEARCVSDFCGGCNARFFDDEGNEVTKSCSKYGYSIINTEHRRLHHWPAISLILLPFSFTFQNVQLKASSLIAVAQPALPPAPTLTPSVHCSVCLAVSVPGGRCLIRGGRSVSFSFSASIEPLQYSSVTLA